MLNGRVAYSPCATAGNETRIAPKVPAKTAPTKAASAKVAPAAAKAGKWVYTFGDGKAEGRSEMRDLLGGKGAGAAEMTRAGMPVPPGFTITTEACRAYYAHKAKLPQGLWAQVTSSIADLEKQSHKGFGDPRNPLAHGYSRDRRQ